MKQDKLERMKYAMEASGALLDIVSMMRDTRIMIDNFNKEFGVYIGIENVNELDQIRNSLAENIRTLNKMGNNLDDLYMDMQNGTKRIPTYNMQIFSNELITYRDDTHLFLTLPEGSGYEGWSVKLPMKFITFYENGLSEWRYYPNSTSVFLYKYDDSGERETVKLDGSRFTDVLAMCNRLIAEKRAEKETTITELAIKVDDFMYSKNRDAYSKTYNSRESGLADAEYMIREHPENVAEQLYSMQLAEADIIADEICSVMNLKDYDEYSNQM